MNNNTIELVEALSSILPTHHEMTLTSKTQTPCISYMETNNYPITETLGAKRCYSRVNYQIKVWSNKVVELVEYSIKIDDVLREMGYKRTSCDELYDHNSTMMQKILGYEGLVLEEFNKGE